MPTEEFDLPAHGDEFDARLTVPDDPDGRGVAMMPGLNHGPWGDVFDRFATEAAADGIHVVRFDGWPTPESLDERTLEDLHAELDAALARLREGGCDELGVVAQRFGGGVTLTDVPAAADRVVLWAPASFTCGDEDGVAGAFDVPLPDLFETPERTRFAPSRLADVDASVLVIQGTDDEAASVENARRLVDALDDAELVVREGEDHSFRGEDREPEIVDLTLSFLRD